MRTAMLATLLVLPLWACSKPETEPAPLVRSVRSVVVSAEASTPERVFSGVIRAGEQSRLSFQVGGRIQRVLVNVGDRVKKGQVIAELDPADLEIQLQEALATVADAQARARSAKSTYGRVKTLYEGRNASQEDLENARAQQKSAQASLAASGQRVRGLRRQVSYTKLKAPGGGTISELSAEANEVASAGRVVAVLQLGKALEAAVDVPEAYINRIQTGDAVVVRVDATPGTECPAEVYEVGSPGAGGTLFPVTARLLPGHSSEIRAGMAASVRVKLEPQAGPSRRLIPLSAVSQDRDGRFVYRVSMAEGELGTVHRVPVEVGEIEGNKIEILSGIEDGQRVVTMGVRRIREGLTVRVPKDNEAAL